MDFEAIGAHQPGPGRGGARSRTQSDDPVQVARKLQWISFASSWEDKWLSPFRLQSPSLFGRLNCIR
eukprot:12925466-Prorocentrum_lima.AAC.1